jgi:L-iditol 2-dehydrogenase
MLACLLKGPGKVVLEDVPVPTLRKGEVLVRFRAGGICGTDIEKIHGGYGPGGILGHEVSGTVEKVSRGVDNMAPGDRVVAHHHVPCYKCDLCKRGSYTMCESFRATNLDPCGFAELFRVPESNVYNGAVVPLPESVGFEEAALIEPTACCLRALNVAKVQPNESVLVVGLGPTGLTQIQILHHMKAGKIIGSDIVKVRREMATRLGAHTVLDPREHDIPTEVKKEIKNGVDLAIVATGNPLAFGQAFHSVRKGSRILLFGAPAQGASYDLDISNLFTRQVSIITSYSCVELDIREALKLVADKKIDLASLITHRFQLKDAVEALKFAASSQDAVKTLIVS